MAERNESVNTSNTDDPSLYYNLIGYDLKREIIHKQYFKLN